MNCKLCHKSLEKKDRIKVIPHWACSWRGFFFAHNWCAKEIGET